MQINSFTTFSYGLVIFWLFAFAFSVQLWYYLRYFAKLAWYKKQESSAEAVPVSVVICARNEEKKLAKFLPLFLEQDYPEYEIVVVNHCSCDNTLDLLDEFKKKYKNLKVVTMQESENHYHGKKVALLMGIKGATHEHLLLTDADCKPQDNKWISNMMSDFDPNTDVVLGYGAYEKGKGLLNMLIRFDTFIIGLQYLSFALAQKTYMGIGRNLAYTKSLFYQAKGFASHYHIESGDDDLFVNEVASKFKTNIKVNLDGITRSIPKQTFRDLFRQKRRHNTTFKKYTTDSKVRLILLTGSQYLFFITFVTLLFLQFEPIIVLTLFGFRLLIQFIIFSNSMKLLHETDLLFFAPILELALLVTYPLITISKLFTKKNKWAI